MKRTPLLICLLVVTLSIFTTPATLRAADAQTNSISEVNSLRSEVERLKAENAALRNENISLRRALAEKRQTATNSVVAAPAAPSTVAPGEEQTGYWLTISSGIRHNSSCRYFKNSKGRSCGPNEGRACKLCGG